LIHKRDWGNRTYYKARIRWLFKDEGSTGGGRRCSETGAKDDPRALEDDANGIHNVRPLNRLGAREKEEKETRL